MKKKSICYIFGAGDYYGAPPSFAKEGYVIAADGGYEYMKQNGIRADMLVGDFDSLEKIPQHDNIRILPQKKDDTDMVAAIRAGWEQGCRIFHIYGGTGGRLDHTLANIQCIADLSMRGARGFLYDRDTVITAITDADIFFPAGCMGTVSVFSHSDMAIGVCVTDLKYPLHDAILYNNYPIGISNEFIGAPGSIKVRSGTLIIIYPKAIQEAEE